MPPSSIPLDPISRIFLGYFWDIMVPCPLLLASTEQTQLSLNRLAIPSQAETHDKTLTITNNTSELN